MTAFPRFYPLPLFVALLGSTSVAQGESAFPTHCTSDEFVYLNAEMARVDYDAKGQTVLTKNGKVLSLCTDRQSEPFGQFTYRYGTLGNVEMERNASRRDKFGVYGRSTSPQTGENIFFFTVGKLTYYVAVATEQGHGVSLYVFESHRGIVYLFSGTNLGTDFEFGPASVSSGKPAGSPLFRGQKPPDAF